MVEPLNQARLVIFTTLFLLLSGADGASSRVERFAQQRLPAKLAQATQDRHAEADRLLEQGSQQYRTGEFAASLQSLQQAFVLYQQLNDRPKQVKTLRNLGNLYYLLSQYDQAIAYYQQSLQLAQAIQNREGEAAALGNLGVIAAAQGNYRQASEYYQQALPLYRQISDRLGEGQTLGNLAEVAYRNADYAGAIQFLNQAIAIAREQKDRSLEANSLGTLGVVYYSLSNYPKAIELHQQHLALSRRLKDPRGEAAALNNLGNSYHALGDYGQAITYLEQRLTIARATQDRLGEAQSLKNLSSVYYDLGSNLSKALDYALKSLAIAQELKNRPLEASAYSSLGNFYADAGDYSKSIEYHQKHLALKRELNDPAGAGIALINLGAVYRSMGQLTKSIELQQQALAIAQQIKNPSLESTALLNLGVQSDEAGQYANAVRYDQQALTIARTTQDRPTEGFILNNLGNTLLKQGKLDQAETTLLAGIQVWEALRADLGRSTTAKDADRVSLYSQQIRTYRLLQRLYVAQNKPATALEIAERGRARVFVELLSKRIAPTPSTSPTSAITISQIQQIAKAQNATLVQYSIIYEDETVNGKVQPRESALYIWVIAPTGTLTFRQVDLKPLHQRHTSLDQLVIASREGIGVAGRGLQVVARSDRQRTAPSDPSLYQLLIQPIVEVLPTDPAAHVIVIPDRSLFLLPFAALKNASGQYLIQQHTLVTAPAIEVLKFTRQLSQQHQADQRTAALVVGNPTMPKVPLEFGKPPEQLPALPGAEREAKTVASLLGTQALIGSAATKASIVRQLPQQRIIHLATHGLLDSVEGLPEDAKKLGVPGAIALAPSGTDNGLLTVDEILQLKLNAELVVLSACDTGNGRVTGDGVIGLSRSFISAGAPSLVVSLWSIPDAPTASFMTEFYQSLKQTPDRAQALRQAMLKTMQQYPNPQDWAAFILIGEAK